ncbi:MAG: toprim domain-containing protein [Patescibacteria group bacterium]|nr:toprim domain-containing protein [Patescibacteria group bacterium]
MRLPDPIQKIASELSELPSIGPRQAIRLAFYLVGRSKEDIRALATGIDNLRNLKICERCFFIHQNAGALCDICSNPNRNQDLIMVVEKETDLVSVENTKKFTGRYFIIGEIPKTGLLAEWQKLRLQSLKNWIQKGEWRTENGGRNGQANEIILGFNPTALGDLQASLLAKELTPFAKKISRLGRGLPTGGEIEFADDETLGSALDRRS